MRYELFGRKIIPAHGRRGQEHVGLYFDQVNFGICRDLKELTFYRHMQRYMPHYTFFKVLVFEAS